MTQNAPLGTVKTLLRIFPFAKKALPRIALGIVAALAAHIFALAIPQLLRDLARQGRLARLRITLQDRPGALFKVMRLFDEHNVNIIEIYHQRIFTTLPAKGLITDIECEARDAEQVERLVEGLRAKGYTVQLVELG